MKKVSVTGNYKLSQVQTLSCSPYVTSRFSPEEVRAVHFQPLMATRVRFLKNTLEAVIGGIEEMEKKTGEMPDNLKQKMGMGYDAEIDSDSPEDMRKFLIEVLGSTMRSLTLFLTKVRQSSFHFSSEMRVWDRIVDTNLDVLDASRSPPAQKTLQALKEEIESLEKPLSWSADSIQPLLRLLGRRLARIFRNLLKMMEPIMRMGGGEQVRVLVNNNNSFINQKSN